MQCTKSIEKKNNDAISNDISHHPTLSTKEYLSRVAASTGGALSRGAHPIHVLGSLHYLTLALTLNT